MTNTLVSLIAGFFASIGVGGGTVLVIYLSVFMEYEQLHAQALNLLFFIPCAFVGLLFHFKQKLIDVKKVFPLVIFGLFGVLVGYFLTQYFAPQFLKKVFGVFLIILATSQLAGVFKKSSK